jgi:hypothetical protein
MTKTVSKEWKCKVLTDSNSKNEYSKTTSVSGNSGAKAGVAMTFEEEYALELPELAESKNAPSTSPEDALDESSIFEPMSVSRGKLRGLDPVVAAAEGST